MSDIQINAFVPDETSQVVKKRKRTRKRQHFMLKPLENRATQCQENRATQRQENRATQCQENRATQRQESRATQCQENRCEATLENGADHQTPPTQDQPAPRVSADSPFSSRPSACARSTLSSTSAADNLPDAKPSAAGTSIPAGRGKAVSGPTSFPTKYLAIDCEMVGTGPKGSISQLARCSIVSYEGDVVYDKFIKPTAPVTNYRTRWSGIRHGDLFRATPFPQARKEILKLLAGKVVIGHAVHNDFKVLSYCHPAALTRDTSRIPLLNQKAGFGPAECASLKRLTKAIFNRDIQTGRRGHSSVEDARASMELYRAVEEEWETKLETSRTNRMMEG